MAEAMNSDLMECKRKALALTKSVEPPWLENGRRKVYMRIMKDLWDDLGYASLLLTPQNLRDQTARLEKPLDNASKTTHQSVGFKNQTQIKMTKVIE